MGIGLIATLALQGAHAATFTVGPTGDHPSLAEAVAVADDGDRIRIEPGTYETTATIEVDLTIVPLGAVTLTSDRDVVLTIRDADVTLSDIDLTTATGSAVDLSGGSLAITRSTLRATGTSSLPLIGVRDGALRLDEVTMEATGERVTDGGGVRLQGGTLVLTDVVATGLWGIRGGAVAVLDGTATITRGQLAQSRGQIGGAVFVGAGAQLTATEVVFRDNTALRGADLAADDAARVTLSGTTHEEASETALDLTGTTSATITDATITGARTGDVGAALHVADGASAEVVRTTICDARATSGGGGIGVEGGAVTLRQTTIVGGSTGLGGGAVSCTDGGTLDIAFTDLVAGAAAEGAALWAHGCTVTVRDSLIAASSGGEAIDASGATLDHLAFWQNAGGDLANGATATATITADPVIPGLDPSTTCATLDLRRQPTSPLVDAASTGTDPDGTPADLGARGGEGLDPVLAQDRDGDGTIGLYDCDDQDPDREPGRVETCDGDDDDCDLVVDLPPGPQHPTWYVDADGDGAGDDGTAAVQCEGPPGAVTTGGDCDDTDPDVRPGAEEVCNGIDDDCDGNPDRNAVDQLTYYPDEDGDGFGDNARSVLACNGPAGFIRRPGDCDDTDPAVNPQGTETCNSVDDDCDGQVDLPDPVDGFRIYVDEDGDRFGTDASSLVACTILDGYAREDTDCDDDDPTRHPRAEESCDPPFADLNCDGFVGDVDNDGDGFPACDDCDDDDPQVYPGAPDEPYDGVVYDCDRFTDYDADADGFEAEAYGGEDCDDDDPSVFPGAVDRGGDDIDQDCDGRDAPPFPKAPTPCGCRTGPSPGHGALALVVLVALRRRRR